MEISFGLQELPITAMQFWKKWGAYRIFAFHGEMGAGKTTFISALCAAKGVQDAIGSPTFSIINEYGYHNDEGRLQTIYHMDLYRIKDEEEAIQAGIEDCFYQTAICLVEWPEKAPHLFPAETLHVYLQVLPNLKRSLEIRLPSSVI